MATKLPCRQFINILMWLYCNGDELDIRVIMVGSKSLSWMNDGCVIMASYTLLTGLMVKVIREPCSSTFSHKIIDI